MSDGQTDDVKLPHIGLRGESGEEMRTWKKIEETKKKAADVMRTKQRNSERIA